MIPGDAASEALIPGAGAPQQPIDLTELELLAETWWLPVCVQDFHPHHWLGLPSIARLAGPLQPMLLFKAVPVSNPYSYLLHVDFRGRAFRPVVSRLYFITVTLSSRERVYLRSPSVKDGLAGLEDRSKLFYTSMVCKLEGLRLRRL